MNSVLYVSLVSRRPGEGYQATFPDLPEIQAEGGDLAELLANARRALIDALDAVANAGEAWPKPTPIEDIQSAAGEMAIPVDIAVDDPPVRVNISLGERLLQRLDAAAETRGMTRSGFIAQSVRVSLGERNSGGADFDATARRLQDELTALGRRINDSLGPDSAFSRRIAELDDQVYEGVKRAADSVSAAMARRRKAASPDTPPESGPQPAA
jgi:predicted RNase H-like HicB family nuclease